MTTSIVPPSAVVIRSPGRERSRIDCRPQPSVWTPALDKANLTQRAAFRFDADTQGLAATFVWDSDDASGAYDTVARVSGRRLGVVGPRTRNDDFVREEHVRGIIPGSGPVSLTTPGA